MSSSKLDVVAEQWEDLHGGEGAPVGARNALSRAMSNVVPASDTIAAAVVDDDERAILVLQDGTLYIGRTRGEKPDLKVEVQKEPLDPARVSVRMVERGWARKWTFERDGMAFLTMQTGRERREYGDAPHAEDFALELCAAVGWDVPRDQG